MSWALDVEWAADYLTGSGTTVAVTYAGSVAAGSTLICIVSGNPASVSPVTVSDSVNGAWTEFGQGSPVTTGSQDWVTAAFYRLNSSAGTPIVTATYSGSSFARGIAAGSYMGIASSSAFDVGAGQGQSDPGTGSDAVSTGATSATESTNELAVALLRTQASVAATTGTGWTQRFNAALGDNMTLHIEDRNVATSAAVTGTWQIDNALGDTMGIVGTFKEAVVVTGNDARIVFRKA